MVVVHRPDLNRTIYCDDNIWYKTLKKVLPENHLKRESECSFSITIKGVKFVVSNDWAIDNAKFISNTDYMLKHNLM